MFNGGNAKSSLSARLSDSASRQPPKINMGAAVRAMEEARGSKDITIKGASMRGNLIEVRGLVAGTTADDVEVCLSLVHFSLLTDKNVRLGYFQALWAHCIQLCPHPCCYRWIGRRATLVQRRKRRSIRCSKV